MSRLTDGLKKLVGIVAPVAPVLASALGGPAAGAAVAAISRAVLGKEDGSDAEIITALQTNPDLLLKLKEADYNFELERERIEMADRDSARKREIETHDSWTPRILAGVVVTGFFAAVGYVLSGKVGLSGEQGILIGTLIGYVSAKADQVLSYYFGSSAGSKQKTEALARAVK